MKTKAMQLAGQRRQGDHPKTIGPPRAMIGASLVEVLVVLVILLIGVFSAIRVFPIGFLGLRQAESRTLATRLASQLMEQVKSDDASLPQGVLFTYSGAPGGSLTSELTVDPDDLGGYPKNVRPDQQNPYFSDVNKFRFIQGEPVKIPLPTATRYGSGSLYTLKFGPIYMDPAFGNSDVLPADAAALASFNTYLKVYGAPLQGIHVQAQGDNANPENAAGHLRGAQTYLIDYGGEGDPARILFPKRDPANPVRSIAQRTFRVAFSYLDTGTNKEISKIISMTVLDNVDHEWKDVKDDGGGPTFSELFEGSVTVNREFNRLKASDLPAAWDKDDPYEYKLVSSNVPSSAGFTFSNIGVLAFNPAGANYSERTPFGQQAFTAYADYNVLDWHILRDDREVPSVLSLGGAIPIKLTLNFVKKRGSVEPDQTTYQGLYRDAQDPVDIQVFDLQGSVKAPGVALDPGDFAARAGADADKDYWIDLDERGGTYRTGTIYINENKVARGSQLRILYKADGDWAVAMQKAYASYDRAYDSSTPPAPLTRPNSYDNYGQENFRLYFTRGDLNKSVVATLEYTRDDGTLVRTSPLQLTIDTAGASPDQAFSYKDVSPFMPGLKDANSWHVVGQISGVSMKARVIWKDNASTSNAWRIQDLDTYITRATGS